MDVKPFVLTGDPVELAIREGPYAGAELTVLTDVPLGVRAGIGRWMVAFGEAAAGSREEVASLQTAWTIFASDVLVSWNVYDRRGLVPADPESFGRVSPRFMVRVLELWADLVTPSEET